MAEDSTAQLLATLTDQSMLQVLTDGGQYIEKPSPKGGIERVFVPISAAQWTAIAKRLQGVNTVDAKPAEGTPQAALYEKAKERMRENKIKFNGIEIDMDMEVDDTGADSAMGAV